MNILGKQSLQTSLASEERPTISINAATDGKMAFFSGAMSMCWNQTPTNRLTFKQMLSQIRHMMDQESRPFGGTPLG